MTSFIYVLKISLINLSSCCSNHKEDGLKIILVFIFRFFVEVSRVLKPGGSLVVYGYGICELAPKEADDIFQHVRCNCKKKLTLSSVCKM